MHENSLSFYVVLLIIATYIGKHSLLARGYQTRCPYLYPKVFKGCIPRGNLTSGNFTEVEDAHSENECISLCCARENCNVVFMYNLKCYHVACVSSELCLPVNSKRNRDSVNIILVRPVGEDEMWEELLSDYSVDNDREKLKLMLNDERHRFDNQYLNDLIADGTAYDPVSDCEVGIDTQCSVNEECVAVYQKSRSGICRCKTGYTKSKLGLCEAIVLSSNFNKDSQLLGLSDRIIPMNVNASKDASITPVKELKVSVVSKEVQLPENEVSLSAYVVPVAPEGKKYQYEWHLQQQPPGTETTKEQDGEVLHLSKLSEGLYVFKVSVSGPDAYGETFANVSVLPPKRINQPPQVIITPVSQTVKLPNTVAVLDASSSKDDDGIISWHWELQQGPLGYQPHLVDTSTLQLDDLKIPGNYTFKVTLTDTDHAINSSTANITVLKSTDYPPEANAGQDVIIYLPNNQVTLNGNLSNDDKAITTWEWTKSPSDADKAADMQDTRTPYLHLSDLEEGVYTFILKVTDSANQSSTSEVHVFVKPPTNAPPVANAGKNITMSLPQTWTILDGSESSDDNKILSYNWEQIEGPSQAVVVNANLSQTNVTGLTKGKYVFKLTVVDDNKNAASSTVDVVVNQNQNEKPKANAGGDLNIELPITVVFLNGSKSSDDLAIVKWKWTRDEASLAIGNIVKGSDETSVLMLTGLVPGRYVFQLTVSDEQGLTDSDTVSIMIKPDPKLNDLVELTVEAATFRLTQSQFLVLQAKLALLVKDGTKLRIRDLRSEPATNRGIVVFYVETPDGKAVPAPEVVKHLKQRLKLDESLLGFSVVSIQTAVCQNDCSGHGFCNEQTRKCMCEAFWMQDMFSLYMGSGEADCNWSVLYVVVAVLCIAFLLAGLFWGVAFLCVSICGKRQMKRKPQNYSLLGDSDDLPNFSPGKATLSESDTDSDVLFESHKKAARMNGHAKASRNGFTKLGRRVKT